MNDHIFPSLEGLSCRFSIPPRHIHFVSIFFVTLCMVYVKIFATKLFNYRLTNLFTRDINFNAFYLVKTEFHSYNKRRLSHLVEIFITATVRKRIDSTTKTSISKT
ncbi:hypothetical protein V8G54_035475 [Vigna mungo]|uniref:Uncharacterized protein n=1 Tax=Vigna mungo TaxID=3915 RepID=A0AAQ3MFH2_VIGMU